MADGEFKDDDKDFEIDALRAEIKKQADMIIQYDCEIHDAKELIDLLIKALDKVNGIASEFCLTAGGDCDCGLCPYCDFSEVWNIANKALSKAKDFKDGVQGEARTKLCRGCLLPKKCCKDCKKANLKRGEKK